MIATSRVPSKTATVSVVSVIAVGAMLVERGNGKSVGVGVEIVVTDLDRAIFCVGVEILVTFVDRAIFEMRSSALNFFYEIIIIVS